jgi:integrase
MHNVPVQISKIHREIESLPKVQSFLSSIRRSSFKTAINYKTTLAYFQEFLSKYHGHSVESILNILSKEKGKKNSIDVYTILEQFVAFMHEEKELSAASIKQYLIGIRSFLAYSDIYVIPVQFKRKVKIPKVYREEEQPLDVKDIRQILLNCHNRRLKAYLLVLASSGTRAVETSAIRLRDIDFSTRPTKIHIRKEYAKTRVGRDIYISDEATKYLKDWINYKYNNAKTNALIEEERRSSTSTVDSDILQHICKKSDSLAFQVQLNNSHVTPQSIYLKLANQFGQLLEVAGFNDRKEGMTRRKITLHSLRRFTKTTISDCAGKEYSEWFLGHAKSSYYVNKPEARATTYAEKCIKYLTFLDYSTLEVAEKRVEAQIAQKDKEIEVMKDQLYLLQERHKQRENDFAELKSAVEFLKDKINAAVIAEPSSKITADENGVPKAIQFTAMNNKATTKITK